MKTLQSYFLIFAFTLFCQNIMAQKPTITPYYELRIYWSPEGKLQNLLDRFKNHSMRILEKHGMKNVGYWVPKDNKENQLYYLLAYPSKEARDKAWAAFAKDKEWKKVAKATEANGKIVSKVESIFLTEVDYSPSDFTSVGNRVFELRTYTSSPYNLGLLNARFRNHTLGLFAKHGMTNLAYFTQEGTTDNLTYFLAHPTAEAQKTAFASFGKDPDWLKAREASETLAKGSITANVKSLILIPTDFSPWK